MSTRRAMKNAPLSQERYMSSPEFQELRGISGSAVAAKASSLTNARQRSLLYFLQAMSLRPGGLPELVNSVLEMFPDRIGSRTMHKLGTSGIYTGEQLDRVREEIEPEIFYDELTFRGNTFVDDDGVERKPTKALASPKNAEPAEKYVQLCSQRALAEMGNFIIELCINPRIEFTASGDSLSASVPYFKDIVGALFEFQARYAEHAAVGLAQTEITQRVAATMREALRHSDRIYTIEGKEGIGKSKAAKTWCEQNAGVARYVSLSGASNKTAIFRSIAKALGLGASHAKKSTELQQRIEDMLQRSKLMLVIDEAGYLVPQSQRFYSRPEMLDWTYTALANFSVPSVLIVTPVFAKRVSMAEEQTVWNARQFRRRCKYRVLPQALSREDLGRVAAKLLPLDCGHRESDYAVDYAITTQWPLSALVSLIEDASDLAEAAGEKINFRFIHRAMTECSAPSDDAQARAFEPVVKKRGPKVSEPFEQPLNAVERPVKDAFEVRDRSSIKRVDSLQALT